MELIRGIKNWPNNRISSPFVYDYYGSSIILGHTKCYWPSTLLGEFPMNKLYRNLLSPDQLFICLFCVRGSFSTPYTPTYSSYCLSLVTRSQSYPCPLSLHRVSKGLRPLWKRLGTTYSFDGSPYPQYKWGSLH